MPKAKRVIVMGCDGLESIGDMMAAEHVTLQALPDLRVVGQMPLLLSLLAQDCPRLAQVGHTPPGVRFTRKGDAPADLRALQTLNTAPGTNKPEGLSRPSNSSV